MLGACAGANASHTGLVTMPVADILGHRELSIAYGISGTERSISKGYVHGIGTTVGLFDRIEVGTAHDFLGSDTWDFKVLAFQNEHGALSAGITNISGDQGDPVVVGRLDFGQWRLHGAWGRFDNVHTGMVGADYGLNDQWTVAIDYSGGRDGYTSLGVFWTFAEGLELSGGYGRPNERSNGYVHSLGLTYGMKF